jgi:hypothetical protein
MIDEQRENIIKEDSIHRTGQKDLLDFLENLLPTTDELILKSPLSGEIDFAILKDCHFDNVTAITLLPGEVTHVANIPSTILRLNLSGNKLKHLVDLPSKLIELNISKNGIEKLDLTNCKDLRILEASENELIDLKLPANIQQVYINSNRLRELDLDGLQQLNTLHCNANPLLSIRNFNEDTIRDFVMENNPAANIRRITDNESESKNVDVDVSKAINSFYAMKRNYDHNAAQIRQKIYNSMPKRKQYEERKKAIQNVKIPCIKCGRPVNTIFSIKDKVYKVKCGDEKNPCELNLNVYAGHFTNDMHSMHSIISSDLEEVKQNIIKIKMDALFGYRSDKSSVAKFNKEYKEYMLQKDELLTPIINHYEDTHFNKERAEKIAKKTREVFYKQEEISKLIAEYKLKESRTESEREERLKDILLLYTQELLPAYKNIQQLKYDYMETELIDDQNVLRKFHVIPGKTDYNISEQPVVKKFNVPPMYQG